MMSDLLSISRLYHNYEFEFTAVTGPRGRRQDSVVNAACPWDVAGSGSIRVGGWGAGGVVHSRERL